MKNKVILSLAAFFVILLVAALTRDFSNINNTPKEVETSPAQSTVNRQDEEAVINTEPEPTPTPEAAPELAAKKFKVSSVIDGDTIKVSIDGKIESIRLIGIDTPELGDSRSTVACFAEKAAARAREILLNQEFELENDPSQGDRDKYQRLLRYIILGDRTNFSQKMIAEGYANEYTYQSNTYRYQADFKAAEKAAKEKGLGLWSPNSCDSKSLETTPKSVPSAPISTKKDGCEIKGNISSKGEKIYHVPSGSYYDKTTIDENAGERWFCTEAEAIAAGWRKSAR